MPNNFGIDRASLAKTFVPVLDDVYKQASVTTDLDGANELAKLNASAHELTVPVLTMDGMADYDRDNGYQKGSVKLENVSFKCAYDRGRLFTVDSLDDAESMNVAFGMLAGEFVRTEVAPELDAWRLASYASKEGVGSASGDLTSAEDFIKALRVGMQYMDAHEVPYEQRILYVEGSMMDMIEDMDLTKSNRILNAFSKIVKVPQSRFYDSVEMLSEDGGGFRKASGGKNLNFMIIHKPAIIQYQKHVVPKVISPEQNQTADAWCFGYRSVGIADVYANKVAGVYKHTASM